MPIRSPASGKGQATDQSRGPRRRASCWQLYCSDNNSLTRSSFHICTRFPASAICPTDAMVWQRAVARNGPPGHLTASGRLPSRRQIQQWQKTSRSVAGVTRQALADHCFQGAWCFGVTKNRSQGRFAGVRAQTCQVSAPAVARRCSELLFGVALRVISCTP